MRASIALLLVAVGAAPLAAQERTVTLPDAIKLALRAQPTYITAVGNANTAHAKQREYIGAWLPTITVPTSVSQSSSTRFNATTQEVVSAPATTSYSAGLNLNMTIFDGLRRESQGRLNGASANSADASVVSAKFSVVLSTKQAFYTALAANEQVAAAQLAVQRSSEQLKVTRDKLKNGSAIRSDTLQAFVDLGNAQLSLLNAQTTREQQEANLARLIGVDGEVRPVGDTAPPVPVALDTAALRSEALRNSPTIEAADAQARVADASVGVARASYFPSITASYRNSYGGTDLSALADTWSASLGLSWTIFNGFTRETGMASAGAQRDAAQAAADDARRGVNAQATQYFAALAAAQQQAAIGQTSRAAAAEGLRIVQERYRLGAATIVDVLTAQASLSSAESQLVTAHLNYQIAKAQIEALIGREL